MAGNVARGGAFEQEVELLLRLKGYTVTRNELINGTQIDLVARKNDLLENLCFVVECTDREGTVGVDLVKQKAAVLLSLRDVKHIFRLIFVARNGFTAEAKAYAQAQPNVLLLIPSDLENQLINFSPYIDWYIFNYEKSTGFFKEGRLHNHYVELVARDEKDNIIPNLTIEVRRWLRDDSNNLIFLLGEYGSGKTSFCRNLVYELLVEKYRNRGAQEFIPLLINLRDHRTGAPNLQQVITDTLINQFGVQLPSFKAFEHVCSSGRVLLVLDGFDEMAEKSDKQTLIDSFNQIYLLASLNAKIILSCRSNFFQSHTDVIELLKHFSVNIPFEDEKSQKIAELSFEHHGRILYLEKLNPDQIREFISKRFGSNAESIFKQINSIHDLSDLSTRPVLLDMILTTLPELAKLSTKINSAALYQHYTDRWTARDDWRVKVPLTVRQNFSEILGWAMHNVRAQEIDYPVLERIIIRSLEPMAETEDQLETFKNDLQTCSFLVRIGRKEQFRFAHKSFQEFFVARKIITDLSKGLSLTKPTVEELYEKKEELLHQAVLSSMFSYDVGRYVLPTSKFDYVYNLLDRRVRLSDAFLTFRESDFAKTWPDIKSEQTVRGHLEAQIREVLTFKGLSDKSKFFAISQEIATFAIEYLENTNIILGDFLEKINSEDSLAIFCDVLRLNQSSEFIVQNSEFMHQYVKTGKEELVKVSFCASLAKIPALIDFQFVLDARNNMRPEGWSYFLFELASKGRAHKNVLLKCYEINDLGTLDKIICVHGLRGQIPETEGDLITESLVRDLLDSSIEAEKSLGLTLCQSVILPHETLTKLVLEAFNKTTSKEMKEQAIAILGTFQGKYVWQALRGLLAKESDATIKGLIKTAEQKVRTVNSQQGNRVNWDQAKRNYTVREKMWLSFRK